MSNVRLLIAIAMLVYIICMGCSSDVGSVTMPGDNHIAVAAHTSGTLCAGMWQVVYDKSTGELNAVKLREPDYALNVIGFLEPPALNDLTIDFGSLIFNDPVLEVDVMLRHPIPDPVFTGFDVRGIVFGPEVLNADGRTLYMSPENFSNVPFGYKDGLLGAPDGYANYSGFFNDYKYFCDGLGPDEDLVEFFSDEDNLAQRGHFSNGSTNTRHYVLSWENTDPPINYMIFNYAIFASYDWPVGDPPYSLDDFPLSTANCNDPFCCHATLTENTLYYSGGVGGGKISIEAEIWDWQGFYYYEVVFLGDMNVFDLGGNLLYNGPGSTSKSAIFSIEDFDATPQSTDTLKIRIQAGEIMNNIGSTWFLGLLPMGHPMYNMMVATQWTLDVPVSDTPPVSYDLVLDEPFTINEPYDDVAPGIIANPSGDVYIGYTRHNEYDVPRPSYAYSTNSGVDWNVMLTYISYTGGYTPPLCVMACDAIGDVYYKIEQPASTPYANIVKCVMTGGATSGIYLSGCTYGSALIFTHDGYPIGFGDYPDHIIYKKGTDQNSPYSDGGWTGWSTTPEFTAVPSPARLSRIRNIVMEPDNSITFVYFSSSANGTWIRTAHNSAGDGLSWTYGNDVYDGASDGYDRVRDASIQLDSSGTWHCAFATHVSTPSTAECIMYVRSSDGVDYSAPVIVYEKSAENALNCPTVVVLDVDGNEILVISFWESGNIGFTYSTDEGDTWADPEYLGTGGDFFPDTCVTEDGYVHTCWRHDESGDSRIDYIRAHFVEN